MTHFIPPSYIKHSLAVFIAPMKTLASVPSIVINYDTDIKINWGERVKKRCRGGIV